MSRFDKSKRLPFLCKKIFMKHRIAIVLFVLITTALSAQSWHVGAHAGFNSVWIINQNNYGFSELDYDFKFGGFGGIAAGYNFNANSGFQVEVDFAAMGQEYYAKVRDFGPVTDDGHEVKVDTYRSVGLKYVMIPVMYRFTSNRNKNDNIAFHAMIGPSLGILLSADQHYEADEANDGTLNEIPLDLIAQAIPAFATTPESEEAKLFFNQTDFGVHLDLGLDIFINDNLYITPAAKMYYGLSDNNAVETRDRESYESSHNFFVGINVGIHYFSEL